MDTTTRIEIIDCEMARKSEIFANLKPGTKHDVLEQPDLVHPSVDTLPGVWVMGVATHVKVLEGEYKDI